MLKHKLYHRASTVLKKGVVVGLYLAFIELAQGYPRARGGSHQTSDMHPSFTQGQFPGEGVALSYQLTLTASGKACWAFIALNSNPSLLTQMFF